MTSIAVIGDPVLDQTYHMSDPMVPGGKMLGRYFGGVPGGTTANFACAAARFGLRPKVFGQVADTWEGKLHRDSLDAFDVQTDRLEFRQVDRGAHTIIAIGPDGEKTLIYVPFPRPGTVGRDVLRSHDMVYVMAADFDRVAPGLVDATAEICVDVDAAAGLGPERFADVAKACDVLFMNDVGFRKLLGQGPDLAAIEALVADRPSLVCCTGGAGISYVAERDGTGLVHSLQMAAIPARVVDTTGAGDCFNAAFLARRAQGKSLMKTMEFAMAAGALATEKTGAREAIPTADAVLERIPS